MSRANSVFLFKCIIVEASCHNGMKQLKPSRLLRHSSTWILLALCWMKSAWVSVTAVYFLILFFFFFWSVVDLQCCVYFCCTAKWFSNTYAYTYILFHIFCYGLSQDVEYSFLCSTVELWFTCFEKPFLSSLCFRW